MAFGILQSAPTVGIIDQTNTLTLSWQPPATDSLNQDAFPEYSGWDLSFTGPSTFGVTVPAPGSYTGGTISYTQVLSSSASPYSLSMQAISLGGSLFDSPVWQTSGVNVARPFAVPLTSASINLSTTTLLLGQPLTVTLNSIYTGADQWQIIWPDNTNTGWLPIANNVVVKSFTTPGAANIVVQTRRNYAAVQFNPPAQLISQFTQQVFVVDQQAPTSPTTQQGLAGVLGIGGQQTFEITTANTGASAPNPWEVLARCLVRDTVTSELKLLVASTRFDNASSLYGTMAVDVFPIEGRPRAKELVVPPYELTATPQTETTPVAISTTTLPTLFVGKSVVQALGGTFQMTATGGIAPFIWTVDPLPPGVAMNTAGVINGTPLALGIFTANFAVEDSSVPPSTAHTTLNMTVETDMLVQIAAGQTDANATPLAVAGTYLGVAQVGTSYNVQMAVGNINPNSTLAGGLPPYTWSAPAGAFPAGLSINSNTGLITGSPQTYNSTTDFSLTYTVTIQVTDSIGAKATNTYTMTLEPAVLEFGHVNQPTVYELEEFKLVVPVFGGHSPYTLTGFGPNPADVHYYGTPVLVDGQIEVPIGGSTAFTPGGFPTTGNRTFSLSVMDSTTPIPVTATAQFTVDVETELSNVRIVPAYLTNAVHTTDGSWGIYDITQATPLTPSGVLTGFQLSGTRIHLVSNLGTSAGNTVYTGVVPVLSFSATNVLVVSGFSNVKNNGAFNYVTSTPSSPVGAPNGTITLNNPNGIVTSVVALPITASANAANGTTLYSATYLGPANFFAGLFFTITGFVYNTQNNGTFLCTASSPSLGLTLSNPNGVVETASALATETQGKALGGSATTSVLGNGIATAIDPTNLNAPAYNPALTYVTGQLVKLNNFTYSAAQNVPVSTPPPNATYWIPLNDLPDSEWFGPPGVNVVNSAAYFGNAQYRVPLLLNQLLPFASVATAVGGTTVYTYETTQPESASGAFVGFQFTVTGFMNSANNGTFTCTASTASNLTLNNAAGVSNQVAITTWSTTGSQLIVSLAPNSFPFTGPQQWIMISGTGDASLDGFLFQITSLTPPFPSPPYTAFVATCTATASSGSTGTVSAPNPFAKAVTVNPVVSISREYTTLAHGNTPNLLTTGAATLNLTQVSFQSATITATSLTGTAPNQTLTVTCANSFLPGETVALSGTAEGFLNGQTVTVVTAAGTQFTAMFTGTNYSNGSDTGTAVLSGMAAYLGNIVGGANNYTNFYFSVTGFIANSGANNGYYRCVASSGSQLVLVNANAVVETHSGLATGDIGFIKTYTRPYIVGDVVGLNPRKPWFNSPQLGPINGASSPYSPIPLTARVMTPATLPPGLSLDANTGLIYGTLVGTQSTTTPVQYVDAGGAVHGEATINWTTYQSAFQLIDNVIDAQAVGMPYNGNTSFTAPTSVALQSASLVGGVLPHGLAVGASGSNITISGTPTEAGYFDCWFSCMSTTGQQAYAYHRISTVIPSTALTVIGWIDPAFPSIVNAFTGGTLPNAIIGAAQYGPSSAGVQLAATGGTPPYTWSPTGLLAGAPSLSLASSGLITGSTPSAFIPNPAGPFTFTVTDSLLATATSPGVTIATQASGLRFTNSPTVINMTAGHALSYQLTATAGTPPYTFALSPNNTNALPTGITVSSSGLVSGSSLQSGYSKVVIFRVVDNTSAYTDQAFNVNVVSGLTLTSGPDFEDSTSTGSLGYVDAGNVGTINPAPNLSFHVVATGVVSTSVSTISVSLSNSSISVGTITLNTGTATATIPLTGSFNAGAPGLNSLVVSVTDSGVQATATFTWTVFSDGSMILAPSAGTFPSQQIS